MKGNIKARVEELIAARSPNGSPISVRAFCLEHDINYNALYNSFKADRMGIKLVDSFKNAVPELNMNWFLYGNGNMFNE